MQSNQSRLVNILVFVPGFLEDAEQMNEALGIQLHSDLLLRLENQLEDLFKWRWRWGEDNPQAAWEKDSGRGGPLGRTLHFATSVQAAEVMTYNAVLLWILALLWALDPTNTCSTVLAVARRTQAACRPTYTSPSPLHLPGRAIQLRFVAIEICRAFDFQIRNIKNSAISSLFFLMPIGLAWSVLEQDDKWKEAINKSLASSQITSGYQTGRNAFGFGSYAVPKVPMYVNKSKSSSSVDRSN